MPQYMITYLGGDQPSSPEEGKQHFSKYMDWLSSLGDSAISPANPLILWPNGDYGAPLHHSYVHRRINYGLCNTGTRHQSYV